MLRTSLPDADTATPRTGRTAAWLAAAAGATAGVLHVAAAYQHLEAGDLVVGFFLATALAQVGAAAWIAARAVADIGQDRRFVLGVLAGTVALLLLYLTVHTTHLLDGLTGHGAGAAGGHAGHATTAGSLPAGTQSGGALESPLLGTLTVVVETLAVLALTALLPARQRGRVTNGLLVLGAGIWGLWLAGVLA
jgi:hypothetical protein